VYIVLPIDFQAREVHDAGAARRRYVRCGEGCGEWFVDTVVMSIASNVKNLLAESLGLCPDFGDELDIPGRRIRRCHDFEESLERIRLGENYNAFDLVVLGQVECLVQPSHVGGIAGCVLTVGSVGIFTRCPPAVVVAAGLIDRYEHDGAPGPDEVLRIVRLPLYIELSAPETLRRRIEYAAQVLEPFNRVENAIILTVAVGPFVVARSKDQGAAKCFEVLVFFW
jgi:hypothetical protein